MGVKPKKVVEWLGSSRSDVRSLGEDICDAFGTDLLGVDPKSVKHLRDGMSEIKLDVNNNTYRLVFIAKFAEAIYVLHAFIKKSTTGVETPRRHANIINTRYAEAIRLHQRHLASKKGADK